MKHKFKIGDRVQFKSWEEMEEEFGLNYYGDIKTHCTFVSRMNNLCGTYATIDEILKDEIVRLKNFSILEIDGDANICWEYSLDMLKPAKKDLARKVKDLEDCIEYGLQGGMFVACDEMSIDEQIEYHEKKLAELKAQKEKDKWVFTEDEKVILRNLAEEYEWIVRDNFSNRIYIFVNKPYKEGDEWTSDKAFNYLELRPFQHLFKCIQWTDPEPCEFRKYI